MNKFAQIAALVFLFVLLLLVRAFESQLFYDPLLAFFKQDYLHNRVPDVELVKLLANTSLRFFINTVISLAILYVAFRDLNIIKFSSFIYLLVFVILITWMGFLVANASPSSNYNILFYVRRFLIQPIIVLLLLPAFYYHKQRGN